MPNFFEKNIKGMTTGKFVLWILLFIFLAAAGW